jgi:MarR family transcriptional regulator, transcriptional regulator for hemolysin
MQPTASQPTWDPESTPSFWINRASRSILRRFDASLKPFGFTMSQLPVLRALADGLSHSQAELATFAKVEQPSMVETLARMERDGIVRREPDPNDRRGIRITITRQSRARLPKGRAALMHTESELMAGFTDAERAQLRELLKRVVKNAEAIVDGPERAAVITSPPKPSPRKRRAS